MCENLINKAGVEKHLGTIQKANNLNIRTPQAAFRKIFRAAVGSYWWLTEEFWHQRISSVDFEEYGQRVLFESHVLAGVVGRFRSGDDAPRSALDDAWGMQALSQDWWRLQNFRRDIEIGRYTDAAGNIMTDAIRQRAAMYASKTRGTANEAFANATPPDMNIDWVMLNIENCRDCPRLEAGSPYTQASLPTSPGMGQTQCLTNCGCVLDREDGSVGFYREFPDDSYEAALRMGESDFDFILDGERDSDLIAELERDLGMTVGAALN